MANIKLFQSKQIRSVWNVDDEKWYFSVQDVVETLTDSTDVKQYIKRMLSRDEQLKSNWGTICTPVEMIAADGKKRKIQASDTKGLLRIIQSIPSPKAEPFKLWLAQVGSERLEEIENPELATQRTRELDKLKGYADDWIEKRMRSIAICEELTDEWKSREMKGTERICYFNSKYQKQLLDLRHRNIKKKGLKSQNLRDHMTDLELIFSMLGEASTTAIVKTQNPIGFEENQQVAKQGGVVAGNARKELESKTGQKVVSKQNYLSENKKIDKKDKNM